MINDNKWNRYTKKDVKEWKEGGLIALGLALLFVIGGVAGILFVNIDYREYKASDDIRTVEATITNVEHTYKRSREKKKKEIWEAKYIYTINGKDYRVSVDYDHAIEVGSKKNFVVYRNSKGDYRIPKTTTIFGTGMYSFLFLVLLLVGVFLLGGGIYCLVGSRKMAKALEQKTKNRKKQRER